jgi:LacI family transcriptional regulator
VANTVTLYDVARRAGVSVATASRAFNGSAKRVVGAELQERVRKAAAELGYVPNTNAQAMVRGRTNIVGLVVQDISDPYFSTVAAGVMEEATRHGLLVTMASTQRNAEAEIDYVATFRRNWARAIIVVGSRTTSRSSTDLLADELARFESDGGRAVAISQPLLPVDTVAIDNRAGARALADALHTLGHQRFGILAGPRNVITAVDRVKGFRDGLARKGISLRPEHLIHGKFTRDGGYEATNELLNLHPDITCIFAVNDIMAVGAMSALRDRGLTLPTDMAIAGFDDIVTLRDVSPSLTTVRIPLAEVGSQALQLALDDRAERPRNRAVNGEVVVRDSTPRLSVVASSTDGKLATTHP